MRNTQILNPYNISYDEAKAAVLNLENLVNDSQLIARKNAAFLVHEVMCEDVILSRGYVGVFHQVFPVICEHFRDDDPLALILLVGQKLKFAQLFRIFEIHDELCQRLVEL